MLTMMKIETPLGAMHLVGDGDELVAANLPNHPVPAIRTGRSPVLDEAAIQLAEYFGGTRLDFALSLGTRGTGFQELVWRALVTIPYGETCSYGDIARAIGRPAASRAVGAANGRNPIAIIVPCHRVIGGDGGLTGYGGGMVAKRWLLDHAHSSSSQQPHPPLSMSVSE
jgi:methylated-DNA-[protein]-cysteine S-methyltransferase